MRYFYDEKKHIETKFINNVFPQLISQRPFGLYEPGPVLCL
jgi:hypothetical protein